MSVFFKAIFDVEEIQLIKSIYSGSDVCQWKIKIQKLSTTNKKEVS